MLAASNEQEYYYSIPGGLDYENLSASDLSFDAGSSWNFVKLPLMPGRSVYLGDTREIIGDFEEHGGPLVQQYGTFVGQQAFAQCERL